MQLHVIFFPNNIKKDVGKAKNSIEKSRREADKIRLYGCYFKRLYKMH